MNVCGLLTVVNVQVDDGDSLAQVRVLLQGVHRSDRDVVEHAEAAAPGGVQQAVVAGVVSGWPHQAEGVPVLLRQHAIDRVNHRTWGSGRVD